MGAQPQLDLRPQLLSRTSVELLAQLLEALGDPRSLLAAGLRLAMQVLSAKRGLAFDTVGEIACAGFTSEEAETIRQQRLGPLLAGGRVRHYSRPGFAAATDGAVPVVGMAGAISALGAAFVLAVERDRQPFDPTDQQVMAEILRLLARPLEQTAAAMRFRPNHAPAVRKLSPAELPLDSLDPFPQLQEMERLLIHEALNRWGNNRTRAAAALGLTREGLRKKLNRYGVGG